MQSGIWVHCKSHIPLSSYSYWLTELKYFSLENSNIFLPSYCRVVYGIHTPLCTGRCLWSWTSKGPPLWRVEYEYIVNLIHHSAVSHSENMTKNHQWNMDESVVLCWEFFTCVTCLMSEVRVVQCWCEVTLYIIPENYLSCTMSPVIKQFPTLCNETGHTSVHILNTEQHAAYHGAPCCQVHRN